ncbi:hypothetical protein DFH28DRAFT_914306 [Melampsora americana]|nr:hypothetical protein DFH28DRAFT_914306 [Melampsora americana]
MSNKNRIRKSKLLLSRGEDSITINDALDTILPTLSSKVRESASQTIDKVIKKVPEVLETNQSHLPVNDLIDTVFNSLTDAKDKTNQNTTPPEPAPEPDLAANIPIPSNTPIKPDPIEVILPSQEPENPTQASPPVPPSTPNSGDAENSQIDTTSNDQPKPEDSTIVENPEGIPDPVAKPIKEEPVKDLTKDIPAKEIPEKAAPAREAVPSKEAPEKEVLKDQERKLENKDAQDKGTLNGLQAMQSTLTDQQNYSESIYAAQGVQIIPTVQHSKSNLGPAALVGLLFLIILFVAGIISFAFLRGRQRQRQSVSNVMMYESAPKPQSQPEVEVGNKNSKTPKKSHFSIPPLMREFYGFPIPGYLDKKSQIKKKKNKDENQEDSFV